MTLNLQTDIHAPVLLDDGYSARAITPDDFPAYLPLVHLMMIEETGGSNMSDDDALLDFKMPGFEIARSTRAVFAPTGEMVAYAQIWDLAALPVRPFVSMFVHPDHRSSSAGAYLLAWGEARCRENLLRIPPDARLVMQVYIRRDNDFMRELLQAMQMTTNRSSYAMHIAFDAPPPAPVFPPGAVLRTLAEHPVLADFIRVYRESFRDHRGFTEEPLEDVVARWQTIIDSVPTFDPALWAMLLVDDEPAGVLFGWEESEEDAAMSWVDILAVLPEQRKRGVGLGLLHWFFGQVYARSVRKVGLGVDGSNLTGATRLYDRAGMHVALIFDAYEKVLRDGVEYSRQG